MKYLGFHRVERDFQVVSALFQLAGSAPIRGIVNRAFHQSARRRVQAIEQKNPARVQEALLLGLMRKARGTRFGIDHGFRSIEGIADYQKAVKLRTYEDLWRQYLQDQYPIFDNLTWPGRVPYLALTSGTTQGSTKFIPVSREMLHSNLVGARTMVSYHLANDPASRLFHGRMFFLGGSSDLEQVAPGIRQGDLSGIASKEVVPWIRPYTFPPLELALEPDWDRKIDTLARKSIHEPISLVGGVPSWLLALFQRVLDISGKSTIAEAWPQLELVVHGGVKFDPYRSTFESILGDPRVRLQESYPCSEGFIAFGDPRTGLLRLLFDHGLFYEFVPVDELGSANPTRHWLGNAVQGVNYAIVVSTCAGMWSHIIGDTVRFESLDPPLLTFTGRTRYTLSAFGEHLISEEIEAAITTASAASNAAIRDWHVGPVFEGVSGYHIFVVEFLKPPDDLIQFRNAIDADLQMRNADYRAHREARTGLPPPALVEASPGGFDDWMRSRGKLGGQHKVPRMDGEGKLTTHLVSHLQQQGRVTRSVHPVTDP